VLDDANTALVLILLTTVVYFDFVMCVLRERFSPTP
jgi:hypothetical protein